MDSPETTATQHPTPSVRNLLLPALIVAVAVGLIYFVRTTAFEREWLSPANVNVASLAVFGLTLIALGIWMGRWAPFSRRTRRFWVWSEVLVIATLIVVLRIDGVTGNLRPKLVWRWQARQHSLLPEAGDEAASGTKISLTTGEHDWPQFLGPNRDATIAGPTIARDWKENPPRELWRKPIGAGWSSFAIVGDYAFTQEQRGPQELVTCYRLADGKLQWAHAEAVHFSERLGGEGPRATPTVHEGKVYAMGATGILNCVDGSTGRSIWRHDVVGETGAIELMYGVSCSPLVVGSVVVVSIGGPNGNLLVAYDKDSGEKVWSAGNDPVSYGSPVLLTLHGVEQIVTVNAGSIVGHDANDGRILWSLPWPEGRNDPHVAQPIRVGANRLLVSMAYSVGSMAFEVQNTEGAWSAERLWTERTLRAKITVPVVYDGYVYGLDEGYLQCIDPADGKRMWRKQRSQNYGHGQVLLVGDLLLVQSEQPGELALVEPTPQEHRELARIPAMEGKSWNYPAVSGRTLLVRNAEEMVCFELPME